MSDRRLVILLDDQIHEIDALPGETIFAAAHRHALAPPFSCVSGYCGECAATLLEGDVEMRVNQHLSERQLGRGMILTCQAVPTTEICRIRFGD